MIESSIAFIYFYLYSPFVVYHVERSHHGRADYKNDSLETCEGWSSDPETIFSAWDEKLVKPRKTDGTKQHKFCKVILSKILRASRCHDQMGKETYKFSSLYEVFDHVLNIYYYKHWYYCAWMCSYNCSYSNGSVNM